MLYSKVFFVGVGMGGIWVVEYKIFFVEFIGKFQCCIIKINEVVQVGDDFFVVVFKDLIICFGFIGKFYLIGQFGVVFVCDLYLDKVIFFVIFDFMNFCNLVFCVIGNFYYGGLIFSIQMYWVFLLED